MQDKMTLHTSRFRILLLRFRPHQLLDPLSYQILHIVFFIDFIERLAAQKHRRRLHLHNIFRIRATRHPL